MAKMRQEGRSQKRNDSAELSGEDQAIRCSPFELHAPHKLRHVEWPVRAVDSSLDSRLIIIRRTEPKMADTKEKLRVGLIGCGGISNAHLPHLSKSADVELVGFCD